MSNPVTFTTLIDLLPNPQAAFVASFDGMFLLVVCNRLPHFGDFIVTPNLKLREYQGSGPALGVVLWVIADPYLTLHVQRGMQTANHCQRNVGRVTHLVIFACACKRSHTLT